METNLDNIFMADAVEGITGVSRFDEGAGAGRQKPIPTADTMSLDENQVPVDESPENIAGQLAKGAGSFAKGSIKGLIGLPADLESLGRGIVSMFDDNQKGNLEQFLEGLSEETTIKDLRYLVDEYLPEITGMTEEAKSFSETAGEFASPVGTVVKGAKVAGKVAKKVKGK